MQWPVLVSFQTYLLFHQCASSIRTMYEGIAHPAFLQTSQEIFMTSLDLGGWSSFFFFISVFVGLIHTFTAQTSSTEEVPLDSRRLSFCLSGVSRSITQRRVSGKKAIDVVSIFLMSACPMLANSFFFTTRKVALAISEG